jgi:hypothetical protein
VSCDLLLEQWTVRLVIEGVLIGLSPPVRYKEAFEMYRNGLEADWVKYKEAEWEVSLTKYQYMSPLSTFCPPLPHLPPSALLPFINWSLIGPLCHLHSKQHRSYHESRGTKVCLTWVFTKPGGMQVGSTRLRATTAPSIAAMARTSTPPSMAIVRAFHGSMITGMMRPERSASEQVRANDCVVYRIGTPLWFRSFEE